MHRGVQLRVVQVFGSHLFSSAIAHGRSICMNRSGNGADVRIARRDRPVNGIALADWKRRRDVFSAGGNPVFNGGIAVIRLDHGGRRVCLVAARQRPDPVVLHHLYGQIGRIIVAFGEVPLI